MGMVEIWARGAKALLVGAWEKLLLDKPKISISWKAANSSWKNPWRGSCRGNNGHALPFSPPSIKCETAHFRESATKVGGRILFPPPEYPAAEFMVSQSHKNCDSRIFDLSNRRQEVSFFLSIVPWGEMWESSACFCGAKAEKNQIWTSVFSHNPNCRNRCVPERQRSCFQYGAGK